MGMGRGRGRPSRNDEEREDRTPSDWRNASRDGPPGQERPGFRGGERDRGMFDKNFTMLTDKDIEIVQRWEVVTILDLTLEIAQLARVLVLGETVHLARTDAIATARPALTAAIATAHPALTAAIATALALTAAIAMAHRLTVETVIMDAIATVLLSVVIVITGATEMAHRLAETAMHLTAEIANVPWKEVMLPTQSLALSQM